MRIGILGGSFSPVHNGHLWLARQAREELALDTIYFVPSHISPLKKSSPQIAPAKRVALLKKATKPYPYFKVSLCELERKGISYTLDTIKYFRKKHAKNAMLFFLSGSDILGQLPRWKKPRELMRLCRFVVMARPGHPWKKSAFPVIRLVSGAPDISSTRIRKELERERLRSKSVRK